MTIRLILGFAKRLASGFPKWSFELQQSGQRPVASHRAAVFGEIREKGEDPKGGGTWVLGKGRNGFLAFLRTRVEQVSINAFPFFGGGKTSPMAP